jgi:hypothetical protein
MPDGMEEGACELVAISWAEQSCKRRVVLVYQ